MQFLYLLLAHLIADFLLQPQKLVYAKHKEVKAVLLHSIVHFLIMMICLFPFWMHLQVLIVSASVAAVHAVIDYIKVKAENSGKRYAFYFFVDQVAHVSLLAMAAVLMSDVPMIQYSGNFAPLAWYLNPYVVIGLCLLIIAGYAYEIAAFQFTRKKNKKFKPDRRRIVRNIAVAFAIYGLVIIFSAHKIAAFALSPFLV